MTSSCSFSPKGCKRFKLVSARPTTLIILYMMLSTHYRCNTEYRVAWNGPRDLRVVGLLICKLENYSSVTLLASLGYSPQMCWQYSRWRHQMETFSALLAICAGNSPVSCEFRAQRPVTRGFDAFFDLPQNKRLSKQSLGWWFETPSHPLWRHCNSKCGCWW